MSLPYVHDPQSVRLGRTVFRPDPRTFRLTKYIKALPVFPESVPIPSYKTLGPMCNDVLSDCTAAAKGHLIQTWTGANGNEFIPTDNQVVDFYSASTGYVRGVASTDMGGDMGEVLNCFRTIGLAGHKLGAYAALEPGNHEHVKASIFLYDGIDVAVDLPASAQKQSVWRVAISGLEGDASPGSWGPHDVCIIAYNAIGPICITWGLIKQMTWSWFDVYCIEAYALFSTDYVQPGQKAPNGILSDDLQADLQLVAA